jgi:hypothetical protein
MSGWGHPDLQGVSFVLMISIYNYLILNCCYILCRLFLMIDVVYCIMVLFLFFFKTPFDIL